MLGGDGRAWSRFNTGSWLQPVSHCNYQWLSMEEVEIYQAIVFCLGWLCGKWTNPTRQIWHYFLSRCWWSLDNITTRLECNYHSLHVSALSYYSLTRNCYIIFVIWQLDGNNSRLLWLKCASVGYLNEHSWVLSPAQAGRYQHILLDIMDKLADRSLR